MSREVLLSILAVMAVLPAVPNVVRVQLHQTYGSDSNVMNTFHVKFTGAPQEADLNAFCVAVKTSWVTHMAPLLHQTLILNGVIATDLTSSNGATGSDIENNPGVVVGPNGVPGNVALVMRYQINRRYRGGHPRQYLSGVPQSAMSDEDHWSAQTISDFEAGYTLFASGVVNYAGTNFQGSQFVNVSYVSGHTWAQDQHQNWHKIPTYRASAQVDLVAGFIVNGTIGTMRRRAG